MATTTLSAKTKPHPWRWWRLQFRLRSLLGLVLLASCVMGAWRTWIRPYELQHQAIEEISLYVNHIDTEPGRPIWLQPFFKPDVFWDVTHFESDCREIDLAPVANFPRLKSLKLNGAGVTDASLAHIAGLSQLETLSLNHTRVTEAGLPYLRRLKNLKKLDLGYTQVHGSGLVHLSGLTKLEELTLDNLVVEDEHLEFLTKLTELNTLRLFQTDIRGHGLGILQSCPKLKHLAITGDRLQYVKLHDLPALEWANLSGAVLGGVRYDIKNCPALARMAIRGGVAEVRLSSLPALDEIFFVDACRLELDCQEQGREKSGQRHAGTATVSLLDVPKLKSLNIDMRARLTLDLQQLPALWGLSLSRTEGLSLRCAELPSLKYFGLRDCAFADPHQNLSPHVLWERMLVNLPEIEEVRIRGPLMSGVSLRPLVTCPKLRQVELVGMDVDEPQLKSMCELAPLRVLTIGECRLRHGALAGIERLTQLEELIFYETLLDKHNLAPLSNLLELKEISFEATKISTDALVHLRCLPNLERVEFPVSSRNSMFGNNGPRGYSEFDVDFEFIPTLAELREFSKALSANCHVVSLATHSNGMSIYDLLGGRRAKVER